MSRNVPDGRYVSGNRLLWIHNGRRSNRRAVQMECREAGFTGAEIEEYCAEMTHKVSEARMDSLEF